MSRNILASFWPPSRLPQCTKSAPSVGQDFKSKQRHPDHNLNCHNTQYRCHISHLDQCLCLFDVSEHVDPKPLIITLQHSTTAQTMNSVTRKKLHCYILAFSDVSYLITGLLNMLCILYIYQRKSIPSIEEMNKVKFLWNY